MRRWFSLAAVLVALVYPETGFADTPAQVYSDFANDGALNCGHSRSALRGVLSDASIQQYGDPYTSLGLKLAVRKQLAGGCRPARTASSSGGDSAASGGGSATPSSPGPPPQGSTEPSAPDHGGNGNGGDDSSGQPTKQAVDDAAVGSNQHGWMVLLGVVLLLVVLGSGGWAAKRAYSDPR